MAEIYILDLSAYDLDGAVETTLRYADGTGYNHPSADGYYEPRLKEAPSFFVSVSANPGEAGPSIDAGPIKLKNDDRTLDAVFKRYNVAGFGFTLRVGDEAADVSTFATVMVGLCGKPGAQGGDVIIPAADRTAELEVPLGRTAFAGTNTGSTGVEGSADGIKGTFKPVAYGKVRVAFPPYCNDVRPIQQLHDNVIDNIDAGYDKGVAITKGSARTFANIDNGSDPSAGNFDYHLGVDGVSGAYTRLVSTEARSGPIFYTFRGDKRGGTYRTSPADLIKEIVEQRVTDGPLTVAGDVTALNGAFAPVCGYFNRDELTVREVAELILKSAGAKWWLSATGAFRMTQLAAPAGTPVVTFRKFGVDTAAIATDLDIVDWRELSPDLERIWKLTVLFQRYWYTQTDGLDANVPFDLRSALKEEWRRTAATTDSAVKTAIPDAPELELETLLDDAADAATLRDYLFALHKVRRDTLQLTVRVDSDVAGSFDIGDAVKVYDILDYGSTGRAMTVLGRGLVDRRSKLLKVKCWG